MGDSWLQVAFLAMEAAWLVATAVAWDRAMFPSQGSPLLPLWALAMPLAGGFLAGSARRWHARAALERSGGDAEAMPAGGVLAGALLAVGCACAVLISGLGRQGAHAGTWLPDLAGDLGDVYRGPTSNVVAALTAALLWWRAQRAGASPPDYGAVVRSFGLGTLLLPVGALTLALLGRGTGALAPAAAAFLAAGLTALALARLQDLRQEVAAGAARGRLAAVGSAWVRSVGPAIGLVLVASAAAALALGDASWRAAALAALGEVGVTLWRVLYWPLVALGYLAELAVLLIRQLPRPDQPQPPPAQPPPLDALLPPASGGPAAFGHWLYPTRYAIAGLAALLVLAMAAKSARPAAGVAPRSAAGPVDRESLWSWAALWSGVKSGLRRLARRSRRGAAAALDVLPRRRSGDVPAGAVSDARAAYGQMLAAGRAAGLPRRVWQTPREYLSDWEDALPAGDAAVDLTRAYEAVRYGPADRGPAAWQEPLRLLQQALHRRTATAGVYQR